MTEKEPFVLWPHGFSAHRLFGCNRPHDKEVLHRGEGRGICSCACHSGSPEQRSTPGTREHGT